MNISELNYLEKVEESSFVKGGNNIGIFASSYGLANVILGHIYATSSVFVSPPDSSSTSSSVMVRSISTFSSSSGKTSSGYYNYSYFPPKSSIFQFPSINRGGLPF